MNDEVAAPALQVLSTGLGFPEGPIAMDDGSVLLVEIETRTLSRIMPCGERRVVAQLRGGPNGAAIGPDGRCYVCNNGGLRFVRKDGLLMPVGTPSDYAGGWIEAVDLNTGESEILYRSCGDIPLRAPNDLVFDQHGGFWFSDNGKIVDRTRDRGAVFYASADGRFIRQVIYPLEGPNGVGLSPDDRVLYVAESWTARVWCYEIAGPGEIRRVVGPVPWERGRLLIGLGGYSVLDSMAIDAAGNVCVADFPTHGITVISPGGEIIERHPMPDVFTTNLCFGGPGLQTAFVTLSSAGQLVSLPWPRGGLPLHWLNRRDGTVPAD